MKIITTIAALTLASTFALSQPAHKAMPVAQAAPGGKTLVVSSAHQAKGQVYYAITERDRQIYVESDAPLEKIKGQSNAVIGYVVSSSHNPGSLVAGEWHLPVNSIKTGIELRDEHLAGSDWLDAGAFPDVIVQIRETKDIKVIKQTASFTQYSVTLVGDLTLHGVTHTINVPNSSVSIMNESAATKKVARGDLMAVRSKFTITLADYGVSHPVIGEKVAKEVEMDVKLFMSTNPPAKQ